jgi:hypothetical protein
MTPEERELRRALDARSGEPSAQFHARLTAAIDEGRPTSGLMQAVAIVAVIAITLGTVGALLMSRSARNVAHQGPAPYLSPTPPTVASGARTNPEVLPVTDPGFTCRLAVGTGSFGNPSKGEFVMVPRGTLELDPAAAMVVVNGKPWSAETTSQPVLKGNDGVITFDAPLSRWVPTGPESLSGDGSTYAWTEHQNGMSTHVLHVTTVADGTDRSFAVPPPQDPDLQSRGPVGAAVRAVTRESVFITYVWEGAWGAWRLDLASGSLTKITGLPSPNYGAGAIWVTPTRGPNPVGMYSDGDTLARLDLASGVVVDWFHRDNMAVGYLGVDGAGNPLVAAVIIQSPQWVLEIWRVRGPGQADLILSGQRASRVITDKHGTWFANESGVYLYSGGNLQRVSAASVAEVVGPCV